MKINDVVKILITEITTRQALSNGVTNSTYLNSIGVFFKIKEITKELLDNNTVLNEKMKKLFFFFVLHYENSFFKKAMAKERQNESGIRERIKEYLYVFTSYLSQQQDKYEGIYDYDDSGSPINKQSHKSIMDVKNFVTYFSPFMLAVFNKFPQVKEIFNDSSNPLVEELKVYSGDMYNFRTQPNQVFKIFYKLCLSAGVILTNETDLGLSEEVVQYLEPFLQQERNRPQNRNMIRDIEVQQRSQNFQRRR